MNGRRVDLVQVVGAGPAGLGVAVAADRCDLLVPFLLHGATWLDAHDDIRTLGRRNLGFAIRSNSPARHFLAPLSATGLFSDLFARPAARRLAALGDATVPMSLVADLLTDTALIVEQICRQYPRSRLHLGRRVSRIRRNTDGTYSTYGQDGRRLGTSKALVLALGAEEITLGQALRDAAPPAVPVIASRDILSGHLEQVRTAILEHPRRPVVVIGSSHSALSAVGVLLDAFGPSLRSGHIRLFCRSVRLYYPSALHAEREGPYQGELAVDAETGEVNRFVGLRGEARALFRKLECGEERRVSLGSLDVLAAEMARASAVVHAVGYRARQPVLEDPAGNPIRLAGAGRCTAVDENLQVLQTSGSALPHVFGMGIGFAPITPDGHHEIAWNCFQGGHAGLVVQQLLRLLPMHDVPAQPRPPVRRMNP